MSYKTSASPYCDCKAARLKAKKHEGARITVVTQCSDGETCNYCGFYVQWRTPESLHWNWLGAAETGREETKNPYDPDDYRIM